MTDPTYAPFPEQDLTSLAEHFEQLAERAMLKNALPATEAGIVELKRRALICRNAIAAHDALRERCLVAELDLGQARAVREVA